MATFTANRGSDITGTIVWPDVSGPFNLTGWTISGFEVSSLLEPLLTLTVTNAAAGEITYRIEWASFVPGTVFTFQVMRTQGINQATLPAMTVTYS